MRDIPDLSHPSGLTGDKEKDITAVLEQGQGAVSDRLPLFMLAPAVTLGGLGSLVGAGTGKMPSYAGIGALGGGLAGLGLHHRVKELWDPDDPEVRRRMDLSLSRYSPETYKEGSANMDFYTQGTQDALLKLGFFKVAEDEDLSRGGRALGGAALGSLGGMVAGPAAMHTAMNGAKIRPSPHSGSRAALLGAGLGALGGGLAGYASGDPDNEITQGIGRAALTGTGALAGAVPGFMIPAIGGLGGSRMSNYIVPSTIAGAGLGGLTGYALGAPPDNNDE